MKVVFCWSDISGYMAACWRALGQRDGINLHVVAYGNSRATAFDTALMEGIPWTPLAEAVRSDAVLIRRIVAEKRPDVVVISGWLNPVYMKLVAVPELRNADFVMGMDTPWRATWRQHVARFALRRYLKRLSAVLVPGERAWQFACRLGVEPCRIHRGLYGVDWDGFGEAVEGCQRDPWPRKFLFAGRYEVEKGVDVLVEGYRRYRQASSAPWGLDVCGMGSLKSLFQNVEGVTDHGFLQPEATRKLMAQAGALVLPSRYDPWPLIVVEAASASLPLIVSEACGSAVDVLRTEFNGLLVSPKVTADELAAAMKRLAECNDLPAWSSRSRLLAEPFSARFWADRWLKVFEREKNRN